MVFATHIPVAVNYTYAVTINNHQYEAAVDGTPVAASKLAVLNKLKSLIDAGEAITATVDEANFKLTLTADVVNTPFTINSVSVTQSNTSTVTNGATATPPQNAGTSVKQVSTLSFGGAVKADYDYKVIVNGTTYTANGTTWNTVLNSLKTPIDAGVTSAVVSDLTNGGLTLTADTANTPFTLNSMAVSRNAASSLNFTGDKVLVLPDRQGPGSLSQTSPVR